MYMKKYDAILCVDPMVNEADSRIHTRKAPNGQYYSMDGRPYDTDDPKMYDTFSFANTLRSTLNNIGQGFFAKVTEFKKWVTVEVGYHNHITGITASKTFLIVFKEKGDGIVLSTHNKYRTISGVSQAASYIQSASNSLQGYTQNRL